MFLSLFNVPGIGTTWLDYVLPLACLLAVPFILPVRYLDIYIYVIYAIYIGAGTLQEAPAGLRPGRREGDCGQVRQHRQRRLPVLRQFIEI